MTSGTGNELSCPGPGRGCASFWGALVDFLPEVGGALAGIPTVLFAAVHSLTAGIVTAAVFAVYTQIENHVLNPVVMSKTVRVSPLFVLVSVLAGASIGGWLGGISGGFVAALLAIPTAAALQIVIRELWRQTARSSSPPSGNGYLPARSCPCPCPCPAAICFF